MKNRQSAPALNPGFQIAPMIDVVFVIMLFFMVMAGLVRRESRLDTQLPVIATKEPVPTPDEIVIRIEDDGQVYLNDDPVDGPDLKTLPELAATLRQLRAASLAAGSQVLVTLHADEAARYERVIDCLDALTRASIAQVSFQAGAPE